MEGGGSRKPVVHILEKYVPDGAVELFNAARKGELDIFKPFYSINSEGNFLIKVYLQK